VADLANLKISVDSRDVKSATTDLNALGAAAGTAEKDVRNVGNAAQSTGSAMRNMTNIIQQGEQAQIAAANANRAVGQTGQLARHHMMNLGFQFQDLGVQIASGANPLTAFIQQGAQIGGIMTQAQIGIGGVVRAFGAMVAAATMAIVTNPILLGIAAAATAAYVAFKQFQSAVAETGEIKDYANSLGLTKKELRELENVHVTFGDVLSGVWATISEGLGLDKVWQSISEFATNAFDVILKGAGMATAGIYAYFAGSFDAIKIVWKNLPAVLGDLFVQAANYSIKAVEMLVNAVIGSINYVTTKVNGVLTSMGMAAVFAQVESVKLGRVANENAGAAARTTVAVFDAYASRYSEALSGMKAIGLQIKQNTLDATKSRLAAQAAALIEKRNEGKAKKAGLSDEQKQFERDLKAAEDYLVSLEKQAAAIGKTTIQLKEMEIAEKAAAAAKVGLKEETLALGAALLEGMRAKERADANKQIDETIKALADELSLLGLTGAERDRAALALEREGFIAKYVTALGLDEATAAYERYAAGKEKIIAQESAFEKERKEAEKLKQQLEGLSNLLDDIFGGAASQIKDIAVTVKANFDTAELKEAFKGIEKSLAASLKQAGLNVGKLGKTLGAGAAGAQVGTSVDAIFKGLGVKSSKMGAQAGGAIGGAAFGPVGAIAGSILGGVLGGMLKKTKTASATISQIAGQGMQTALSGNSAALKDVSNKMASGLLKGLGDMAEQLGGTLGGNVKVSLGMRKNDFVVDPTGAGRTTGSGVKNFGTDQAAAVAYVTQLAIQQGIVTGISAGAQTLIRAGNDLNEQVSKALKFDQVFKDLVSESDPLRSSLDSLSIEMEKLKAIFKEAGASAADYAKLEELYAIKQAKAIFEANRPRREMEIQLMEAQGRTVEALAASRQLELEAMDESLRAMQRQIFAQQDLNAAREAEKSAISDLQAAVDMLNANVANAEANLAEAQRAQRQRQIESYRAQMADLDAIIAKREEAQAALRRAYDAEIARIDEEISKRNANISSLESAFNDQSSIMEKTIDQFRSFAASVREFASTIIPMNSNGRASLATLRARFAEIAALAMGGNQAAMGQFTDVGKQLRDAVISNATDRTSMLRELYALQAQTNAVAIGADEQATIAEQQLATAKLQNDHLVSIEKQAIAQLEAQKSMTTALVGQFIQLTETNLSLDEAMRQLQTAEQAASSAESQKAYLQAQIDGLTALDESVMSVEQAQRELDEAKAERDSVLAEINARGFSELIRVTQQTGTEMARVAMSAIDAARAAAAQAQAAMAAAAARPPVAPIVAPIVTPAVTPPVVSVLPDNVIPFPIMDSGFGSIFGNFDGISLPQNFNGGGGREFAVDNNVRLFANGGMHSGGLRIVGEKGPELEATGPSRIYNSNQLGSLLNNETTAEEVKAMRQELKMAMYQIAKNTGKSYDLMNRWDGDGLPPERIVG
jgi:hypothetical protein